MDAFYTFSDEERNENLKKAQAARREKAEALDEIRAGRLDVTNGLSDPRLQRCPVATFIAAFPSIGARKTARIMYDLHIAKSRRIRGLGPRQKEGLLEALGKYRSVVPSERPEG